MASSKPGRQGSAEKVIPIPHTRLDDYEQLQEIYDVKEKLGEGSFGIVREVIHKTTGERWACKAINKDKAGSTAIQLLEREVQILKRVHHEHIIRLKEVFETSRKVYLVMECCEGGELSDVLRDKKRFSEEDTRTILKRLASAISYLHKNDMVHRDLKLENILLSKNPADKHDHLNIKVTDFGLSVVKGGVGHENMLMDFCGTPMYMAPEIIDNKTYGYLCDVWAMGVITYMLLSGSPPFHSSSEDKLYDIIKTADIRKQMEQETAFSNVSNEAKDCICCMLTVDPAHRYSSSEVADHPWLTGQELDPTSNGPRNVLEMMKQWREDLSDDKSTVGTENNTIKSADSSSSRGSSASSSSKGNQNSASTSRRASHPTTNVKTTAQMKKKMSSDSISSSTSTNSLKSNRSSLPASTRGVATKTRSPVESRDNMATSRGIHVTKTTATRTTNGSAAAFSSKKVLLKTKPKESR